MSDINQLRYELQALVARYPDFQIDLSQIRVVQSIPLMGQPVFQPPQPNYLPQPSYTPTFQPPVSVPPFVPTVNHGGSMPTAQTMTRLVSQPEGVEIIPPKMGLPPVSDPGIQDVAQNAANASIARIKAAKKQQAQGV